MEFILTGMFLWLSMHLFLVMIMIKLLPLIIGVGVVWFICWIIHKMVSGKVK